MGKEKKRKRDDTATREVSLEGEHNTANNDMHTPNLDTSKPSAVFTPQGGRSWTVSIALPGSIVSNAQSHNAKTSLAGAIARALAVFCVDEVVIFDDGEEGSEAKTPPKDDSTYTAFSHPSHFLAHLLSFLETPAHLRKQLFPMHANLKTAGSLPSLDMPHHLKASEWCEYREGVSVEITAEGTSIDVGLDKPKVVQDAEIPVGTRVTLQLSRGSRYAQAVNPADPRETAGYYWGFTIRQCRSLSTVLTECPFDGGYDLSIGTSERGQPLSQAFKAHGDSDNNASLPLHNFQHLLLVFGGVAGLETAAVNDAELVQMEIGKTKVGELFDYWVNVLPGQGSRTIRTEEAVWLGLMGTRQLIEQRS